MIPDEQGSTAGLRRLFLDAARAILAERAGESRTAPCLAFGMSDEGAAILALQLGVAAKGLRELVSGMQRAEPGLRARCWRPWPGRTRPLPTSTESPLIALPPPGDV